MGVGDVRRPGRDGSDEGDEVDADLVRENRVAASGQPPKEAIIEALAGAAADDFEVDFTAAFVEEGEATVLRPVANSDVDRPQIGKQYLIGAVHDVDRLNVVLPKPEQRPHKINKMAGLGHFIDLILGCYFFSSPVLGSSSTISPSRK